MKIPYLRGGNMGYQRCCIQKQAYLWGGAYTGNVCGFVYDTRASLGGLHVHVSEEGSL